MGGLKTVVHLPLHVLVIALVLARGLVVSLSGKPGARCPAQELKTVTWLYKQLTHGGLQTGTVSLSTWPTGR